MNHKAVNNQSRFKIMQQKQAAYTLIEILVVLLIISIVSGVVLLTVGRSSYQAVRTFQAELLQVLSFAQETAILQPAVLMVEFKDQTVNIFQYIDNNWVIFTTPALHSMIIPHDVAIKIELPDEAKDAVEETQETSSRLLFSSSGQITPFKIYIGKLSGKPQYIITNTIDGNIISQALP